VQYCIEINDRMLFAHVDTYLHGCSAVTIVMVNVADVELVSSAVSRSHDMLSYADTGLQSDPLNNNYHSSGNGVMDVLPGATEVTHLLLNSSPSVVTLLHDKLDSQLKV